MLNFVAIFKGISTTSGNGGGHSWQDFLQNFIMKSKLLVHSPLSAHSEHLAKYCGESWQSFELSIAKMWNEITKALKKILYIDTIESSSNECKNTELI